MQTTGISLGIVLNGFFLAKFLLFDFLDIVGREDANLSV